MTTTEYIKNVGSIINDIKKLARKYYKYTYRPLGVTGEIAEYETIRLLNLEMVPARQPGFDAYRQKGKRKERIQIKGRVLQDNSKQGQRLGSINLNKEWDYIPYLAQECSKALCEGFLCHYCNNYSINFISTHPFFPQ
jgi:hypothetical protein